MWEDSIWTTEVDYLERYALHRYVCGVTEKNYGEVKKM